MLTEVGEYRLRIAIPQRQRSGIQPLLGIIAAYYTQQP